ncbi:MAG: hypothetical protein IJ485_06615 [Lachnospiraceae bacterium]|nr:hypothetical protein [Lachnospiraceae bacterium]
MEQEILFAKTLEKVKKTAKEQGNVIAKHQIQEAFADMKLDEEQFQMIYDYLTTSKIGVDEEIDTDSFLTEEDTNYLEIYLEELKALPELSDGEKQAVTLSALAGDKTARNQLIEIYLPKVVEVAKLYAGQGVFLEDLIGEGNVALAMGVEMLGCLESADEVEGMLGKMMMDAMELYIEDSAAADESNREIEDKVNLVAEKAEEIAKLLQRKITVEELAREAELTAEQIEEAIQMSGGIEFIELPSK